MSSVLNFHDGYDDGDMPPDHHYSSYDESTSENADFFDNHPFLEAVFCYGWLFLLFYCLLCRNNREPPSTEVGDRIRARARENAERIQQKKIKEELSPLERKKIVNQHMVTKVVLSKDEQGNLTLGVVESESSNDVESQQSNEDAENEAEAETTDNSNNLKDAITHLQADDEDDEEGFTCVICLDCFEVDDKISWTKHDPTCRHVFHDECIRQWLEDRRQDECPSCRCHLVPPPEVPKAKSMEDDSDEESGDATPEQPSSPSEESEDSDNDEEPKEDGESGLFSMVTGLFRSSPGRPPSAPRSGEYNLVSVNSGSFDSQEAPEQLQDTEVPIGASSSSSEEEELEEGSSTPRPLLASTHSVETMSISEALRQSEVMEEGEEEDEEKGKTNAGAAAMELGMEDAVVSDIVFSP